MESLGELGRLTDSEYGDLNDRVDRFHAAWKADGSVGLEAFVPPAGVRHRLFVLVELIKTDMERRAEVGLPIRVETYLGQFHGDISPDTLPVSLLVEEYRLRHRHADKPKLDEYRVRFAAHFEALQVLLREPAPPPSRSIRRTRSVGIHTTPTADTPSLVPADPTKATAVPPPAPSRGPTKTAPPASPSGTVPQLGSVIAADILPAELQYKLLRRIGKGAFGEVYEALAPGGFKVAVKRILRSADHPATQGELESLEAIKTLRHVYLLQTHFYKLTDDKLVLVMDLADGSLADRIEHHQKLGLPGVPPEELIPLFEQAGKALDYLHSQNVTHRDVKPQNLLIQEGYIKVADFGLARHQQRDETNVGMEVGTPLFMAPEVWRHKVSIHSDQYSLAATYVVARLGRQLYPDRTIPGLADSHCNGTPDLHELPDAEQRVLLRALAKNPEERYPSCLAFAADLRRAVLDRPVEPKSNRLALIAAVVAGALAVGLIVGTVLWLLPKPDPAGTQPTPGGPPVVVTPKKPWVPVGWTAVEEAGVREVGGRALYYKLTRKVGDEDLVAHLVYPTRSRDPDAFYMLENKITNRVFAAEWRQAEESPGSDLQRFQAADKVLAEQVIRGEWRKGAIDQQGNRLGIAGEAARKPVVAVTVAEAMIVAEELGGLLPTFDQWQKAAGATGDGKGEGPAGAPLRDVPGLDPKALRDLHQRELRLRRLALGLDTGPAPVDEPTDDVSHFNIRQLISNGFEWTSERGGTGQRLTLSRLPMASFTVRLTAQSWEKTAILTYNSIRNMSREADWAKWEEFAGFRIVLEPR